MSSNIFLQRICQHCGKEFTARTTVTQYCGDSCAKKAYKARQKAAKIEASNQVTQKIKEKPLQDIKNKEYLSIADACKLLGLSRWTIWRAIKKRELAAAKIGRTTIIQRAAIDKLFALQPLDTSPKEPAQHTFNADDCYTISQVLSLYTISESALNEVIKRNNITRHKQGRFSYVPKVEIENILTDQLKH